MVRQVQHLKLVENFWTEEIRSCIAIVLDAIDNNCTRYIYAYTGRCTKDARAIATCLSFIHMGNTMSNR